MDRNTASQKHYMDEDLYQASFSDKWPKNEAAALWQHRVEIAAIEDTWSWEHSNSNSIVFSCNNEVST